MIPRGAPDLGWGDLWCGLKRSLWPGDPLCAQAMAESAWSPSGDTLACLSVRSGFDLLLQELALPAGSEVLISAATIPDMAAILAHHGLVPVPIDLNPDTLSMDAGELAATIGPRTVAILVAHLFGSRMPLDAIVHVAERHQLLLIEDCAQVYDGGDYRGHPASDVSMFSFGPIKTATALGGALLRFKDRLRLERVRQLQARYPRQSRLAFAQRVVRFAVLKGLSEPRTFGVFVALCRARGINHDLLIHQAVRGFAGSGLIPRLRQQPSAPLLWLLERRVRQADPARVAARAALATGLAASMPHVVRPGRAACCHFHWVFPIESRDPDALVALLWFHGFDATRRASSMVVIAAPPGYPEAAHARHMLERLVYLPIPFSLTGSAVALLGSIVQVFEEGGRSSDWLSAG